ncbi:MAG: alpha-L-rhamnosidase C-terminal domain-containing protein, partial [Propionicimonas sp.]|nr:alpha-L-rhamnosidase C-terminal domain-containing protein [Propionicimonas sp.]
VSSRLPNAGSLETSSPLVQQLLSNIRWSQRGNFLSVPTDCPQRDERLGWTADAQVFVPTATYLSDVEAFFDRWLLDLRDNQLPNGSVPDVVPLPPPAEIFDYGAPGWGDAAVVIPWHLYRTYGNRELLARQYSSMKAWVDYVTSRNPGGLWCNALGNNYGDWLAVGEETPSVLVATAYRARSADLVSRAAEALGRHDDAAGYAELASQVRTAFVEEFVHERRLAPETQTGYLFALAWELVPREFHPDFSARLAELIRANGSRLSTGFLGVGLLCPVLTGIGETPLAFDLLFQTEYPSWGYSIRHGATTIWERWDAWTEDAGFQAASMNSFNHYSLGSVGEWLYSTVGGVAQTAGGVGFEDLVLAPRFDPRLDFVRAEYEAPRGRIRVAWQREEKSVRVQVEIPPGTSAVAGFLSGTPRLVSGQHEFLLPPAIGVGGLAEAGADPVTSAAG